MVDHTHILSTKRIEAFSDGVFAIVVTILVLDFKVPELSGNIMLPFLLHLIPQFAGFVMSFLIVCIYWVNHHQFFAAIKQADRKLLWLNNLLLFWLCFIPFPTALIGRYPLNTYAVMLFSLVLFFAGLSFTLMSGYTMFHSSLFDEHISMTQRNASQNRSYIGVILYALSALFAPFAIYMSLVILVLVPLIYFIPRRLSFTS